MADTELLDTFDTPEPTSASREEGAAGVRDQIKGVPEDSAPTDDERQPLRRRLADAFREGVASAKPDHVGSPRVRMPPRERKARRDSEPGEVLDRAVQQGRVAAEAVWQKTAAALDYAVQLARRTPASTDRIARAFREGAETVRQGVQRSRRPAGQGRASVANETLAGVVRFNESARTMVVDAIAALKPSPNRSAWRGIRQSKRRIIELYAEIGREAVRAWGDGPVTTEKLTGLLDELRKNENAIQKLMDQMTDAAAAKPAATASKSAARGTRIRPSAQEVVSPVAETVLEHAEKVEAKPPTDVSTDAAPAESEQPAAVQEGEVAGPMVDPVLELPEGIEAAQPAEASTDAEPVEFEQAAVVRDQEVAGPAAEAAPEDMDAVEAEPPAEAGIDADQAPPDVTAMVEDHVIGSPVAEQAAEHADENKAAPRKHARDGTLRATHDGPRQHKKKR